MKNKIDWDVELASYKASGNTIQQWCEQKSYSVSALKNHLYKKPKDTQDIVPIVPPTSFVEVKPEVAPTLMREEKLKNTIICIRTSIVFFSPITRH